MTCRVLQLARQPYYGWLAQPVTDAERAEAYRANALFDAHVDDPEFGHRLLADQARQVGEAMTDRTAWRICADNGWWSSFGKRRRGKAGRVGAPVHDDRVGRELTARGQIMLWLTDIPPLRAAPARRATEGKLYLMRHQGRVFQPDRRLLDQ